MKAEKGITLISLVITVVLLIILAAVSINAGFDSIGTMKLQNFNYELQQVQGKVDTIYEKIKLGQTEYITLGSNITESTEAMQTLKTVKNIDYSNIAEEDKENYYYEETNTTYRYLTEAEVKEVLNISSNPGDMIINFITKEVISVEGFDYDDTTYYTLTEFNNSYTSTGNALDNMVDLAYRLIPKEYQQVEYVKLDPNNPCQTYLKTNIRISDISNIILKYGYSSFHYYNDYHPMIISTLNNEITSPPWICTDGTKSGNVSISPTVNSEETLPATEYSINCQETSNNLLKIGGWSDNFWTPVGMYYYVKIYNKNDKLIFNGIPCYCTTTVTNVDGESCPKDTIGLYDTVEGKFYTNKGTGTFVKGADV